MRRKVAESFETVPINSTEKVIPDPGRLIFALRQIGYSLEQALSDLVDNSINAEAKTVLIRFLWKNDKIKSVVVADDGTGMSYQELQNAMRFGSDPDLSKRSLGKYGLGLKLASFSHARKLLVVSRKAGKSFGRRWTIEGIRRNWNCDILSSGDANNILNFPWSPVNLTNQGTIVLWDDIDKLPTSSRGLIYTLRMIQKRLQIHIGLHFHRFLEHGEPRILIDQQEIGEAEHQIRVGIEPLNPFAYPESAIETYPKNYVVNLNGTGELNAEGHIWPPNSDRPEYRLGNRAAARQGFYFYRNDRLIQAGGWNGLVQNDSEPHSSLARVKIDLSSQFDSFFNLNVQKSCVIVPTGFSEAVRVATDPNGEPFEKFRQVAETVYRKRDNKAISRLPKIPLKGIPKSLQKEIIAELNPEGNGTQQVNFYWESLGEEEIFQFDAENSSILLNKNYRQNILAGLKQRSIDVPLFKLLIFFLLKADLGKRKISAKRRQELNKINRILVSAAELSEG